MEAKEGADHRAISGRRPSRSSSINTVEVCDVVTIDCSFRPMIEDDLDEFLTCFRLKTEKGEKAYANHKRHRTDGSPKCAEEPAT